MKQKLNPTPATPTPLYCSFCGKCQHEVFQLLCGPAVFICDECVELCADIITEKREAAAPAASGEIEYSSWFKEVA